MNKNEYIDMIKNTIDELGSEMIKKFPDKQTNGKIR